MIHNYPMRNAHSGLCKPLWLRLEHCKVYGKQLNLEKWMYTPESTPLEWCSDCPPLEIPYLDLPVPQSDALLTRPPDSNLRQQMPTDVPLRTDLGDGSTADPATLANQYAQDYSHRRVVDDLRKIVRQTPEGLKNFLASSILKITRMKLSMCQIRFVSHYVDC
jgi:hypothetical protein